MFLIISENDQIIGADEEFISNNSFEYIKESFPSMSIFILQDASINSEIDFTYNNTEYLVKKISLSTTLGNAFLYQFRQKNDSNSNIDLIQPEKTINKENSNIDISSNNSELLFSNDTNDDLNKDLLISNTNEPTLKNIDLGFNNESSQEHDLNTINQKEPEINLGFTSIDSTKEVKESSEINLEYEEKQQTTNDDFNLSLNDTKKDSSITELNVENDTKEDNNPIEINLGLNEANDNPSIPELNVENNAKEDNNPIEINLSLNESNENSSIPELNVENDTKEDNNPIEINLGLNEANENSSIPELNVENDTKEDNNPIEINLGLNESNENSSIPELNVENDTKEDNNPIEINLDLNEKTTNNEPKVLELNQDKSQDNISKVNLETNNKTDDKPITLDIGINNEIETKDKLDNKSKEPIELNLGLDDDIFDNNSENTSSNNEIKENNIDLDISIPNTDEEDREIILKSLIPFLEDLKQKEKDTIIQQLNYAFSIYHIQALKNINTNNIMDFLDSLINTIKRNIK